jgi:hypothetical protein
MTATGLSTERATVALLVQRHQQALAVANLNL